MPAKPNATFSHRKIVLLNFGKTIVFGTLVSPIDWFEKILVGGSLIGSEDHSLEEIGVHEGMGFCVWLKWPHVGKVLACRGLAELWRWGHLNVLRNTCEKTRTWLGMHNGGYSKSLAVETEWAGNVKRFLLMLEAAYLLLLHDMPAAPVAGFVGKLCKRLSRSPVRSIDEARESKDLFEGNAGACDK